MINPISYAHAVTPPRHISTPNTGVRNNGRRMSVEITPNAGNVSSGDKSQNAAEVSISTPNQEQSIELTREQAISSVQFQMTQNALERAGVPNVDKNPVKKALFIESGGFENETVQNIAVGRHAINTIDTYQNVSENSIYNTEEETSSQEKYQEASNAYIKQSLLIEKSESLEFSAKA